MIMHQQGKKFSIAARLKSFQYAFNGVRHVAIHEHNMRIHLLAAVTVIAAGWWFHVSPTEWVLLLLTIGLVLAVEMINTAIEKIVDMISPGQNKTAGLIKDIAAGAVWIAALIALIVGLIIFIPKIL
jgi:diacylglycerol kinase